MRTQREPGEPTRAHALGLWLGAVAVLGALGCEASQSGAGAGVADTASGDDTPALGDTPTLDDMSAPDDTPALDDTPTPTDLDTPEPPDLGEPGDVPLLPDLPDLYVGPDVSPPVLSGECAAEPTPGGSCVPSVGQCSWGTETCCGKTYPSLVCSCDGGQWSCYYTDACLLPPGGCPDADAGPTDVGPDLDAGPAPDLGPDEDVPPPSGPTTLVEAGWSFGECMGPCVGSVVFEGAKVTLTVQDWNMTALHVAHGILMTDAAAALEQLLAALDTAPLQAVYGCPDCADGGAFHVALNRNGVDSKHVYEYGQPPEVLKDLDQLVKAVIDALRNCNTVYPVVIQGECPVPEP